MRTPPCSGSSRCLPLCILTTTLALISCGGDDGASPVEPDPNAIKFTTLVPGGERASSPSWSPDGNTVAFTKDVRDDPQKGIYTDNVFAISSKGGTQTKLSNQTDNADASTPVWSADGSSILFSAPKSGDPFYQTDRDLWIVPAAGGVAVEIATLPADSDPLHPDDHYDALVSDWSPDGNTILFNSPTRPGYQCCELRGFLVPPGGGEPQDLAAELSGAVLSGGTWSPDGTSIACSGVTAGSDDSDIYIVPVGGGIPTLLVGTPVSEGEPDWSPDGESIVYASLSGGKSGIWVVPAAGGTSTEIKDVSSTQWSAPLWSPDGRYIVYSSFADDVSRLWIVPATGGAPTKLAEVDYQHAWYPNWSPDGAKLAFVTGSKGIAVVSSLPAIGTSP